MLLQCRELSEQRQDLIKQLPVLFSILYLLLGVVILPSSIALTDRDVETKSENDVRYDALYRYLREQKGSFYFIDVYSSVAYTEKMFVNVDNSLANYDIMGGWACKSPLWRKKLSAFGIENMEEALTDRSDVYYVQEKGADTGWLSEYYEDHGDPISLTLVDTVDDSFEIYSVTAQ